MSVAAPPPQGLLTAEELARLPETVRQMGAAYWNGEQNGEGLGSRLPALAIHARLPGQRWVDVFRRAVDHLNAGGRVACVVDWPSRTLTVYYPDRLPRILTADDDFTLPDVLGDFRVKVGKFFA